MFVVLSPSLCTDVNTVFITDRDETVVTSTGQETVLRAFRHNDSQKAQVTSSHNELVQAIGLWRYLHNNISVCAVPYGAPSVSSVWKQSSCPFHHFIEMLTSFSAEL